MKKDFELKLELLDEFKRFARRPARAICFWYYVGSYCHHKNKLLFIPDVGWLYSWSNDAIAASGSNLSRKLHELIKNDKTCNAKAPKWTIDKLTNDVDGCVDSDCFSAVITLDGQVFLKDYSRLRFITVVKDDHEDNEGCYRYFDEDGTFCDEKGWVVDDKFYNPNWAVIEETLQCIEDDLFQPALDKAYNEWYEKKKNTKEYEEWHERRKAQRLVKATNRKMKLCMEAKSTIDLLQAYLDDIANNKATQGQNVKVNEQLSKLISANKSARSVFVNNKKKKKK